MRFTLILKYFFALSAAVVTLPHAVRAQDAQYVMTISVDGLGSSYLETLIADGRGPNFNRFFLEGAGTFNARNDYDYTVTLPNHVTIVTARGITGTTGHGWTDNGTPAPTDTIHNNKGSYVASAFDVAHDNGLRTGLYAGKSKFSLIDDSYNAANGAADVTGPDNGRDKISSYVYNSSSSSLLSSYLSTMGTNPFNYSLLHFTDPDTYGHASGWGSTAYYNSLATIDGYLGQILSLVNTDSRLKNRTTIVLTADHGGNGYDHSDPTDPLDYTIPFAVWGFGAKAGADLYGLNPLSRQDPGSSRPTYLGVQPIRNGDIANLALDLLGLGPIPASTLDYAHDLVVPEPGTVTLLAVSACALIRRRTSVC